MTAPSDVAPVEQDLSRVATVPNLLSVLRLVLLGIALYVLFAHHARVAATVLLLVAGSTDFLDGFIARRFHQVSELGKVLDPTVDRIVLGASAIGIVVYGAVPIWLASIVLAREAIVGIGTLVLGALGAVRIDVVFVGKAGAFGLMVALPCFLLSDGPGGFDQGLRLACWYGVALSLTLAFAALALYVPKARVALATGRAQRITAGSLR